MIGRYISHIDTDRLYFINHKKGFLIIQSAYLSQLYLLYTGIFVLYAQKQRMSSQQIYMQDCGRSPFIGIFKSFNVLLLNGIFIVLLLGKSKCDFVILAHARRNWCKSINLHVVPCLHYQLVVFIVLVWNCTCNQRFVYTEMESFLLLKHVKYLI